jgi:two-component system, NarL family, response regulator LiaR
MNESATSSPRIRVLIVDGDDPVRGGLASLLAKEPDIEVVAEATNGRSGVQLASELRPVVVLVSIPLSDLKGSEATRAILQRSPTTRVIAFIVAPDGDDSSNWDDIERVVRAGASGLLARDTPIDQIVTAVRAAGADSRRLLPEAVEAVLAALRATDALKQHALADRLSQRELEVLRLIGRGLDNEEIADAIRASPRSVEQLVSGILGKLGPPDR